MLSANWHSSSLLGDMGGLRPALAKYGLTLTIQEQSEVLGNVSGGARQGFDYDGLTTATLQMDTQRAFGLYGGLFNVSALQIHGRSLSADNLYTLQTASGIEADRATRLWELWYQQKMFDDKFDVKIGQQSLDQEFMGSQNANYFINTMFGWPMLPSADLPGGGPAYPLSALGVRGRLHVTNSVTVLAGVFNGSPVANNMGDPQLQNPSGISFPLNGGALAIAELQFSYPSSGTLVQANETDPLARTYKIGVWYDTESFADQRYDNTGLSLANPASDGIPATHPRRLRVLRRRRSDDLSLRRRSRPQHQRVPAPDVHAAAGSQPHQLQPQRRRDDARAVLRARRRHGGRRRRLCAGQRQRHRAQPRYGLLQSRRLLARARQARRSWRRPINIKSRHGGRFSLTFNTSSIPAAASSIRTIPTQKIKNETVLGIRTNITF